ncbi:PspC domain-containing protein [Psychrosphaera sp. B3R10]|uniref:PspC domain-containing protein n=1 Tax=unclassified Psychrosphaera TaxID=2641570 RepID=UPI001C099EBC|nr:MULTISPECIES: PspC domain-containing protein [unclassified Psychrosphaera]MBU2882724.1 PspC domain-containing protein [Psychrosphaera sp. I2R16]MBU2989257.1 PspC domain-containing protein [Psychrosphaera sp. B3R10]MDO6718091.1 PspC domain-containing protein [Psychrosphaera sp. 1_MG-2023]
MKSEYLGKPLAKDYLNRKLSGVCAGIAAHYGQPTWLVRAATIGFGLFFPAAAIFGYLLAVILMPTKRY